LSENSRAGFCGECKAPAAERAIAWLDEQIRRLNERRYWPEKPLGFQ